MGCGAEKVKKEKVYLTAYLDLIEEWDSKKDGDVGPNTVTRGLHKKV